MKRTFLFIAAVMLTVSAPTGASTLKYLGSYTLPADAPVNNISGLTYDSFRNLYYAISDRDGAFSTLSIAMDETGIHHIQVLGKTYLDRDPTTPGTQLYEVGKIDAEDLAVTPDQRIIVTSEHGDNRSPWIRVFTLDGAFLKELSLPRKFIPTTSLETGIRPDLAFEAMTLSPEGNTLYIANEQALYQDYDTATPTRGTVVRIVQYALQEDPPTVIAEYAYMTEPIFAVSGRGGEAGNGVSAMAFVRHLLPQYDFVVMERSYVSGMGYDIKLFGVSLAGATNIMHSEELPCLCSTHTVRKTLLTRISTYAKWSDIAIIPDNMEAMALGPRLANGHATLLLASDNEANGSQPTLFFAFELVP
jgi:hypothetical protein